MKRSLITGGAGFIGSHLAERLLEKGQAVMVIDDLSTGSMANISPFLSHASFHFVKGTIMDEPLLRSLVEKADLVFHLAAAVGVKYVIANPLRSILTNVKGTELVLEVADSFKKKVLFTSSSEVYGKNKNFNFSETDDRIVGSTYKSRWAYATTKALGEVLALAYHRERALPVVIVRLFNVCGPRQSGRYGMVIPRFVQQALSGEPITVYGDGKQKRCFLYIKDAIDALIALSENPMAEGQIINLGSQEEITIEALARKVKSLTKSPSEIMYVPYEEAYEEGFEDMFRRVPNLQKIKDLIGFEPRVSLEELLTKVIEATQHQLDPRLTLGHF